jgi:hypothetical protein
METMMVNSHGLKPQNVVPQKNSMLNSPKQLVQTELLTTPNSSVDVRRTPDLPKTNVKISVSKSFITVTKMMTI